VRLTPNMNFGMCNTWVILRRNVIYLYSKKPHLDQLFHCRSSRYVSPNDIISANFDSEKVDQDGIFYCKDVLHFVFK
jgi:hypothetical protein